MTGPKVSPFHVGPETNKVTRTNLSPQMSVSDLGEQLKLRQRESSRFKRQGFDVTGVRDSDLMEIDNLLSQLNDSEKEKIVLLQGVKKTLEADKVKDAGEESVESTVTETKPLESGVRNEGQAGAEFRERKILEGLNRIYNSLKIVVTRIDQLSSVELSDQFLGEGDIGKVKFALGNIDESWKQGKLDADTLKRAFDLLSGAFGNYYLGNRRAPSSLQMEDVESIRKIPFLLEQMREEFSNIREGVARTNLDLFMAISNFDKTLGEAIDKHRKFR